MLKVVARRAGIEKRVHSHAFLHSLAYQMVVDGVTSMAGRTPNSSCDAQRHTPEFGDSSRS